ncbi:hypothetical protein, partial [Emticicia fontis]
LGAEGRQRSAAAVRIWPPRHKSPHEFIFEKAFLVYFKRYIGVASALRAEGRQRSAAAVRIWPPRHKSLLEFIFEKAFLVHFKRHIGVASALGINPKSCGEVK